LNRKTALITGVFGQDGSYLCEILSDKGYGVYGVEKSFLSENSEKIKNYLFSKGYHPTIYDCDLYSYVQIKELLNELRPDEIYHLAATHYSSQTSTDDDNSSIQLFNENVASTLNLLTAMSKYSDQTRCVLAGSCLMFDASDTSPQNETTQYETKSMYGLSKITENNIGKYIRNRGLHVSMAIFYNHESPRRADSFVTKKIVKNMVLFKQGKIDTFELGDLDSTKDWGYARDYVNGLWLMAQQDTPQDYILATGQGHTIRDFVQCTANILGLNDWESAVRLNAEIIKRNINTTLIGKPDRAESLLRWRRTLDFNGLVEKMVRNEIAETMD
jgi:GDPmannose 4,6-dehydratase